MHALSRALSTIAAGLILAGRPAPARADVVVVDDVEVRQGYLMKLYPDADPNAWKVQRYRFSDKEVELLEKDLDKDLGFAPDPEDRIAEFFIAHDEGGGLLGVAVFIDPRTEPKVIDDETLPLRVGVGVNARGEVDRVKVYDYGGNVELTRDAFLRQLKGRNLRCSFTMGDSGLDAVEGYPKESQLIASAGREALLLMRMALGSDAEIPPCTR